MLIDLFLILSAIGAPLMCALIPSVSFWWLVPLFAGLFLGLNFLYLLSIYIASLLLPRKAPAHPNRYCMLMIFLTMQWLMRLFRVKIRMNNTEILPDEPAVFVSNHLSDFDPMAVLAVFRRRIIYISKESNFKIPIVGNFIRRAGFLAIDRENGMRALRTLKRAAEMILEDKVDVGIYPEGTRSKTGELLEFKSGAFYLAKKANAPIVIMTTKNSNLISKNCLRRRTTVELDFLEVMDAETVKTLSTDEICAYVRQKIAAHLGQE